MNRWDIINSFIEKHNFKSYLEIGYYKGWSFDQVKCNTKLAVDPHPCKTPDQEKAIYGYIFPEGIIKMTSDDFFYNLKKRDSIGELQLYDIIFIDGLHEAQQVTKDIHNALSHLSPGGIIVMHDCNPPQYEHTTTGINGCWTGDTYKAWIKFRAASGYFTYTIDTDWGIGIIDTKKSAIIDGDLDYLKGISIDEIFNLEWNRFDTKRVELLNLISVEEFKTKLNERTENSNSPA